MSKFKVFQINLTDEEIDTINAADDHGAVPKNVLRMKIDMPFGKLDIKPLVAEAFELGYYEHVANITLMASKGYFTWAIWALRRTFSVSFPCTV